MVFLPDEAKLVSIFIQTLLYGAYAVVFGITYWVLVYKHPNGKKTNRTMLAISMVMFILATMHIGVNYTRVIRAFITFRNEPGGPAAYFNRLSDFTQIFGSAIYTAQTLVGDSVMLMRCYYVWGQRWSIIFVPLILLLGCAASGIGILYSFVKVVPQAEIFVEELQSWITAFFCLTLATNIICTVLIATRIWYINRSVMIFNGQSWNPVIGLVLESGSIYSTTLIALLILYRTHSWFQYVLLDAISPIVGLVFSMIIVRIGLGITPPGSGNTLQTQSTSIRFSSTNDLERNWNWSVQRRSPRSLLEPHPGQQQSTMTGYCEELPLNEVDPSNKTLPIPIHGAIERAKLKERRDSSTVATSIHDIS